MVLTGLEGFRNRGFPRDLGFECSRLRLPSLRDAELLRGLKP